MISLLEPLPHGSEEVVQVFDDYAAIAVRHAVDEALEVKDRRVYTSERRAPENHEYPFPMHYLIPLGTRVHIELEEIKE